MLKSYRALNAIYIGSTAPDPAHPIEHHSTPIHKACPYMVLVGSPPFPYLGLLFIYCLRVYSESESFPMIYEIIYKNCPDLTWKCFFTQTGIQIRFRRNLQFSKRLRTPLLWFCFLSEIFLDEIIVWELLLYSHPVFIVLFMIQLSWEWGAGEPRVDWIFGLCMKYIYVLYIWEYTVKKKIRCSGDYEILHEKVCDITQKLGKHELICAVSLIISCSITSYFV